MEIGNVVQPTKKSGFTLRCGTGPYADAVLVSKEPFMLVSRSSDMLWSATVKSENFEATGEQVDEATLNNCLKRIL
jgi:hypothetical protein